jgi:hypothetical protein
MYTNLRQAGVGFSAGSYWSSAEFDGDFAWSQGFLYGFQDRSGKDCACYVRPVRGF